jgi:hypothetical protein
MFNIVQIIWIIYTEVLHTCWHIVDTREVVVLKLRKSTISGYLNRFMISRKREDSIMGFVAAQLSLNFATTFAKSSSSDK